MACSQAISPRADDEAGYVTAVFAGLTFMLALVGIAGALLARQQLIAADADARHLTEAYDFEGRATAAALRLLKENGAPTLRWREASDYGVLTITLEPEGLKVSAAELARPQNDDLIAGVVGRSEAYDIQKKAAALQPGADGAVHRAQLLRLSEVSRWRDCAATLVSPFSRLTAFNVAPPSSLTGEGSDAHAGEVWRITIDAPDGAWLDRIVRLTGSPAAPAAIVDEDVGRVPGNGRTSCLPALARVAGRPM